MSALDAASAAGLAERAAAIRRTVVRMCRGRGQGYAGQGLALADLMACLHWHELRPGRDRLLVSTGHSAIAVFAALGELGDYDIAELETYGMDGSRIEESPLEGLPGFPVTAGSLGQGVSQAVGMALGERLRGGEGRVYCLLSDGELQEGQVWEAVMAAAHYGLDNLVLMVDDNGTQADGRTAQVMGVEPIVDKLSAFGLAARRVDAHDIDAILAACADARSTKGRPTALVCRTVLGKGSPTLEAYRNVHYVRAEPAVWERAAAELADR